MDRFEDKLHGSLAHYRSLNEKVLRTRAEEVLSAAQDELRFEFCERFPPSDPAAIDSAEFGGMVISLIERKQQAVRVELRPLFKPLDLEHHVLVLENVGRDLSSAVLTASKAALSAMVAEKDGHIMELKGSMSSLELDNEGLKRSNMDLANELNRIVTELSAVKRELSSLKAGREGGVARSFFSARKN
jgi:hypothetical protein